MTATLIDARRYGRLLAKTLPKVIESEEENERALRMLGEHFHREDLTPEEEALMNLLVVLVEKFEAEHHELAGSTPLSRLKALVDEHELKQADLLDVFGSRGIASEVLNGKREISKAQARKLGERFGVSPALFLVD
jgi:HTH-type transcriptional regulator/antitoxin HigA